MVISSSAHVIFQRTHKYSTTTMSFLNCGDECRNDYVIKTKTHSHTHAGVICSNLRHTHLICDPDRGVSSADRLCDVSSCLSGHRQDLLAGDGDPDRHSQERPQAGERVRQRHTLTEVHTHTDRSTHTHTDRCTHTHTDGRITCICFSKDLQVVRLIFIFHNLFSLLPKSLLSPLLLLSPSSSFSSSPLSSPPLLSSPRSLLLSFSPSLLSSPPPLLLSCLQGGS